MPTSPQDRNSDDVDRELASGGTSRAASERQSAPDPSASRDNAPPLTERGSESKAIPQQEDSPSGKKPQRKRKHGLLIVVGVIGLVLGAALGGYYYWRSTFYESTNDAYIEGHPVPISARVSGNVKRIHVTDNQYVQAGALLAEIDPCDYQARLTQAQAALQSAQAAEEQAVADVNVAEAELHKEQQDLTRYEELAKEDAVATQILNHTQAATRVAQANLAASRMRLASARARIVENQAAADQARLELSYTRVYAPQSGYVTRKSAVEGSFASVGQPLLSLVTEEMYVIANFKETQLTHMRPGQPVTISVDAYPGIELKGHVQSIQAGTGTVFSLFPPENATGNFVKVVQRVPVKIVFEQPEDPNHFLALGMSVEPKVRIK